MNTTSLIGLANELPTTTDGWVKLSPYGDFPKIRTIRNSEGALVTEKFLQRIDAQAARGLERKFNSVWGRMKRFFVGAPVYKHHPDLARHQPNTVVTMLASDGEPKGLFTGLEARTDGLYARLVLLPAGREAVEREGLKYLSPFW